MRNLYVFTLALFLSACASPYKPEGFGGGYSDTQLDTNVFRVSFRGNGYTREDRAAELALLRGAEIALQHGFRYFAVVDSQNSIQQSTHTTPTTATTNINSTTYGTANRNGNYVNYSGNTYGTATTTYSGGQTYTISKPRSSNTIVCFAEKPEGFSYNAEIIVSSLKQKYGIK